MKIKQFDGREKDCRNSERNLGKEKIVSREKRRFINSFIGCFTNALLTQFNNSHTNILLTALACGPIGKK